MDLRAKRLDRLEAKLLRKFILNVVTVPVKQAKQTLLRKFQSPDDALNKNDICTGRWPSREPACLEERVVRNELSLRRHMPLHLSGPAVPFAKLAHESI